MPCMAAGSAASRNAASNSSRSLRTCALRSDNCSLRGGTGLGTRSLPRRLDQRAEGLGIAGRDLRQRLAVEVHARPLEAGDELTVGHVERTRGGVDADDPQSAEVALLEPPAGVGEISGAHDRLLRRPVELSLGEEIALGQRQDLLAALPALVPSFDSRHETFLFRPAEEAGAPRLQAVTPPGAHDGAPEIARARGARAEQRFYPRSMRRTD